MRIAFLAAVSSALAGFVGLQGVSSAGAADMTVSGPVRHENLSIYFVRGRSEAGPVPLTLAEALEAKAVRVIETGSVNDLKIEAIGRDSVFIQAGDIVKGGQQDRVLMSSLLLTPGAGKVSIGSYCVEAGRWAPRGKEDAKQFSSSSDAVPSRVAKLVLNASPAQADGAAGPEPRPAGVANRSAGDMVQRTLRPQNYEHSGRTSETTTRQKKIWDEVAGMQAKLKANTGAAVAAEASKTSLQLSLEHERVRQSRQAYIEALQGGATGSDIIGFVIVINGRINSAELYPSNALFKKMWPKQLIAAATEAIADKSDNAPASSAIEVKDVEAFLAAGSNGKTANRKIGAVSDFTHVDSAQSLYVEARTASGQWYHRSYVAK